MLELQVLEACSQGLQVSARRHHWLVHEDPLAPLLVKKCYAFEARKKG